MSNLASNIAQNCFKDANWVIVPGVRITKLLYAFQVPQIQTVCVDLNNIAETQKVLSSLGDIHLLVNNAAVAKLEPFMEVTEEAFDL